MLRAALLFYKRLRRWLEDVGFKVNPYDPCVAKKIVHGNQITICWHVDDQKVSHKDEDVVTAFAIAMGKEFGNGTTIKRGKVFDYLGMELDFDIYPRTMIVSMIKYLQKIIQECPEILRGTTACPATANLFKMCEEEDRELLSEEMAKQFHRTTAQLLFLCKRARPDVETLISFLTTRVKQPDKDDWKKLRHGLMYLKGTLHIKQYLAAEDLRNII